MGDGLDREAEEAYNALMKHNVAKSGEHHEKTG
jgi:hypothetical protein